MVELPVVMLLTLAGLALADSLSVGALGLPALMLTQPRVRWQAVLLYLLVLAAFYAVVGVILRAGALAAVDVLPRLLPERAVDIAQLVIGVGLFAASFLFDGPVARRRAQRRAGPSRWQRWSSRVLGAQATNGSILVVALGAGAVELATMVPYLAAIGILVANGTSLAGSVMVLAAYCLVMIIPALILLVMRMVFASAVEPLLRRISAWFSRRGMDLLAWVMGIVGVLLVSDAIGRLRDSFPA